MAGPVNPQAAPEGARGGQYVTVPGFATPGQSAPTNTRTADGSTIVYSPRGWKWEEVSNEYDSAVSKLATAAIESAVRRVRTSFGTVFYIRGDENTEPPFRGEVIGDTLRVQDAQTLNIVSEWKWNGVVWERMRVSSEQISNLDVGRLTAGSASITEVTARKIAADVGRFLEVTTDQLTVTGNASFVDATAHHIWSKVVTSGVGEFEKIKSGMIESNAITSDHIRVGALDGQVITGARIQTSKIGHRGIKIDDSGLAAYDLRAQETVFINAQTGEVRISGRLGRSDTWSECFFDDIVWDTTGTDVSGDGARAGVGLAFRSKINDWKWGTISMRRRANGIPELSMQAPTNNMNAYQNPYILLSKEDFTVAVTELKNGKGGFMKMNQDSLWAATFHAELKVNLRGVTGFTDGTGVIINGTNGDSAWAAIDSSHNVALWMNRSTGIGLNFGGKTHMWANSSGLHIGGTKKFSMRVPQLSRERGGMLLEHSATESPYDGIEYWENIKLDSSGKAQWVLPDYVPRIASPVAPWVVFATAGATATLDRSNPDRWVVDATGRPGETIGVLVKGARQIDMGSFNEPGEPEMKDFSRQSPWHLPPDVPTEGESAPVVGGGYYGPASRKEEKNNDDTPE